MEAGATGLTGRQLLAAGSLGKHVFQRVICVSVVSIEPAAVGQIHGHRPLAGDIGLTTGVDVEFDRHPVADGDDLDLGSHKTTAACWPSGSGKPCL